MLRTKQNQLISLFLLSYFYTFELILRIKANMNRQDNRTKPR